MFIKKRRREIYLLSQWKSEKYQWNDEKLSSKINSDWLGRCHFSAVREWCIALSLSISLSRSHRWKIEVTKPEKWRRNNTEKNNKNNNSSSRSHTTTTEFRMKWISSSVCPNGSAFAAAESNRILCHVPKEMKRDEIYETASDECVNEERWNGDEQKKKKLSQMI